MCAQVSADGNVQRFDIASLAIEVEKRREQDDVASYLVAVIFEISEESVKRFLSNAFGARNLPSEPYAFSEAQAGNLLAGIGAQAMLFMFGHRDYVVGVDC